jgi:tRNA (mo5U34)-methyltransferase
MNVGEEMAKYYWYHCVDLGGGVVTDGDYDLRPLLPQYGFPARMDGMRVLDVGRASGFFAFEFEDRGADVTATEIGSYLDWDFVGGEIWREKRRAEIGDEQAFNRREIYGAFDFAHGVRGSRVRSVRTTVYDLGPQLFGGEKFDLVFAGSISSHVRDPILALERLHGVTRGECVLASPAFDIPAVEKLPMLALVGTADSDRRSWWTMNVTGLVEMLRCANFSEIEVTSRFDIVNRRVRGLVVPHVVVRARP